MLDSAILKMKTGARKLIADTCFEEGIGKLLSRTISTFWLPEWLRGDFSRVLRGYH